MIRTCFFVAALSLCGAFPRSILAHEALATTIDRLQAEMRQNPAADSLRSQRAWLMLDHGLTSAPVAEDIDTLWRRPAWRNDALRLRAWHLYLQDRFREASAQARRNLRAGIVGPEQYRLLAGAALARRDTAESAHAYLEGWEELHLEEDYLSMVRLAQGGSARPRSRSVLRRFDTLLDAGVRAYPNSPGVYAEVFQAYLKNRNPASLRKALDLSNLGQVRLWPGSVDWKIWHARALLAAGMSDSAQGILLRAMDILEGETRLRPDSDLAMRLRQEIFELLDSVHVKKK